MRVIGLDVGEKRIGVARGDMDTRIAVPVGFLLVDGSEWQKLAQIAQMNGTDTFVVGLPRSNEGNETAQSAYARNFAKVLTEQIPGMKVIFQDESFTSVEAEERLRARKQTYDKGEIDAEAATIILQDFFERPSTDDIKSPLAEDKNGKKKSKKLTKILSAVIILVVLALLGTAGVLWVKDYRAKQRAEEYARQEAAMQAEVFDFTILPGETIYDIKAKFIELGYSSKEVEEAFNADYDFAFLKGRPAGATLEGYLYGETHEFNKGVPVKDVLEKFLEGMGEVIKENNLEARYSAQGLTLFEGITLASIVQKEAHGDDQPTVAQVFYSRMNYGMLLGSDVTVAYALDTVDPNRVTYTDNTSALTVDSCYNTRLYAGLPCGPISNPGLSALLAAAQPSDTAYLYFLTGDDGLMYYSYTEEEHNQNIYSHCQNLCNVSL